MHYFHALLLILAVALATPYPAVETASGGHPRDTSTRNTQENRPPAVTIVTPAEGETVRWGSQIRYEITVSDAEDGESRYDEIAPNEVLLELRYLPEGSAVPAEHEHPGLSLIRVSGCFDCHRDRSRLTGPSFAEIAGRYDPDAASVAQLGTRIVEGSSGNWGSVAMPPHRELSHTEAERMARYILRQGASPDRRITPGLEGLIRVMDKPAGPAPGAVALTASYRDHGAEGEPGTRKRGAHTIILRIE